MNKPADFTRPGTSVHTAYRIIRDGMMQPVRASMLCVTD